MLPEKTDKQLVHRMQGWKALLQDLKQGNPRFSEEQHRDLATSYERRINQDRSTLRHRRGLA